MCRRVALPGSEGPLRTHHVTAPFFNLDLFHLRPARQRYAPGQRHKPSYVTRYWPRHFSSQHCSLKYSPVRACEEIIWQNLWSVSSQPQEVHLIWQHILFIRQPEWNPDDSSSAERKCEIVLWDQKIWASQELPMCMSSISYRFRTFCVPCS